MFEVGVVGQFEAAHRLRGDFGPAQRTHGHTYRVEASVRGDTLRDDGTLFNITTLQAALDDVLATLHYRDLDETHTLAGRNSTAEVVAHAIHEGIAPKLSGLGLGDLTVRVWESPRAWAAYRA